MPGVKAKSILGFHPNIKHGKTTNTYEGIVRKKIYIFSLGNGRKLNVFVECIMKKNGKQIKILVIVWR